MTSPKHKSKHPWRSMNRNYRQPTKVAIMSDENDPKYSAQGVMTGALAPAHGPKATAPTWQAVLDAVPDQELLRYLDARFGVEYYLSLALDENDGIER